MRSYLISNNAEMISGLRLAGIEGEFADKKEDVIRLINKAKDDEKIGLILIDRELFLLCEKYIHTFAMKNQLPVIAEIPNINTINELSVTDKYIKETVGISL